MDILQQTIPRRRIMAGVWRQSVMAAVNAGDDALIAKLLQGNHIQELNFIVKFQSPLTKASRLGKYAIAEHLLCAGASVEFMNDLGRTPLMEAAYRCNTDICHLLLNHGANVNARCKSNRYEALHYAAGHAGSSSDVAALLIKHGAEPYNPTNPQEKFEDSPFAMAIHFDCPHIMDTYLDYCENNNYRIPSKLALSMAIDDGSCDCAIILLKRGLSPIPNGPLVKMPFYIDYIDNSATYLYVVADRGLVELIGLLVELNPHMLQEETLVQSDIRIFHLKTSISWLTEYRKQPPSLVKLCRYTILSQLDSYYMPKIDVLPLPKSLKTFLKAVESAYEFK